jgi:LysR family nitrogen assimilation transcriptional regulator
MSNALAVMDLLSLRYFAEVVRQRSITKAAVRLGMVQPALTRRIQLLEEELGTPLLLRHRRGVEPTDLSIIVFDRADAMLRMAQDIETEVQSHLAEPVGHVRFGFPPSIGSLFISKLLSDFFPRFPRVTFYLLEDLSGGVCEALLAGRIDVGIMSFKTTHPDLEFEFLFEEDLWLIGRASDWPFGRTRQLKLEALRDRPLLATSFVKLALEQLGVEQKIPFRIVVEADSMTALREATRAGAGLFVTPHSSVERELESGEYCGARIQGFNISRGLFRRRDRSPTRAVAAFVQMINDEVRRMIAQDPRRFRAAPRG